MANFAEQLTDMGMPYPLAAEVISGMASGTTAEKLLSLGTSYPLAIELARQINARSYNANWLLAVGMASELAAVVVRVGSPPVGTFYINLPDPILYSNTGWGIVGTGLAFLPNDEIAIADGEGKVSDAGPTDPRLWSVCVCDWDAYTNTLAANRWFNGSDIMAGLFEDTAAPVGPTAQPAVVSTDYGLQGVSYITATGRLQLTLVNPNVSNLVWILQIDPTTGARTGQIRIATGINHMETLDDGGVLSPARSIAIASAAMTLRRNDTGGSIGTGKTHGLTNVDMGDFDVARGLLHVSSGANDADGLITTWLLNTSNASLTGTAAGTYTDTASKAIEGIRSRSDALYRLEDSKYHGARGGLVPNRMIVTRPNPLLALYP